MRPNDARPALPNAPPPLLPPPPPPLPLLLPYTADCWAIFCKVAWLSAPRPVYGSPRSQGYTGLWPGILPVKGTTPTGKRQSQSYTQDTSYSTRKRKSKWVNQRKKKYSVKTCFQVVRRCTNKLVSRSATA